MFDIKHTWMSLCIPTTWNANAELLNPKLNLLLFLVEEQSTHVHLFTVLVVIFFCALM